MQYAMSELHSLISRLTTPVETSDRFLRYICAIFSELAYYHVPEWEIDGKKRAKLVPSIAYQTIISGGVPNNLEVMLRQLEFENSFVVASKGVVAVGILSGTKLFIGFRGTKFLFDWGINLRSDLVPIGGKLSIRKLAYISSSAGGRLHSGFTEEAVRISIPIVQAIAKRGWKNVEHIILTGHSLGGAVAAISEKFLSFAPTTVCIFGAPRYADAAMYFTGQQIPPTQIRRPGDIVPLVPPKMYGYADHPIEYSTAGHEYIDPSQFTTTIGSILRLVQFVLKRFEPHNMEIYRNEVGAAADMAGANWPLAPISLITKKDIKTQSAQ